MLSSAEVLGLLGRSDGMALSSEGMPVCGIGRPGPPVAPPVPGIPTGTAGGAEPALPEDAVEPPGVPALAESAGLVEPASPPAGLPVAPGLADPLWPDCEPSAELLLEV